MSFHTCCFLSDFVVLSSQESVSVLEHRGYSNHNLTALEQGAMERKIDELEGRLAAINDKLSGVNQFNDDKQKFKDETELEFAQHKLVLHEVVEGARKEFEGLRQAILGLHCEIATTVTNLQQRVVHLESNSSGAYNNKSY